MKRGRKSVLVSMLAWSLLTLSTGWSQTSVPHSFSNGTPADADQINENFDVLVEGLNALTDPIDFQFGYRVMRVDCSMSPEAFVTAYNNSLHLTGVYYHITGRCRFPEILEFRGRYIQISGVAPQETLGPECSENVEFFVDGISSGMSISLAAGGLELSCLSFKDLPISTDPNNPYGMSLWATRSSTVRLASVKSEISFSVGGDLNSSLLLLQAPMDVNGIRLQNSSTARLVSFNQQGSHQFSPSTISVVNNSTLTCTNCDVTLQSVRINTGSKMIMEHSSSLLPVIEKLQMSGGAQFISTSAVTIDEQELDNTSSIIAAQRF